MKKYLRLPVLFVLLLCILAAILTPLIISQTTSVKLIRAIENNDIPTVQRLLERGVDPNKPDIPPNAWWGILETSARTPLSVACKAGNVEIVNLLIEHGASAEYQPNTGWSPLRQTLFYYHDGDEYIVEALLQNGASATLIEDELPVFSAAKMTPKVYDSQRRNGTVFSSGYDEKCAKGITEIVFLLLGNTSVDVATESGETLLMLAASKENLYLAQHLIAAGCNTELKSLAGKTALDYALETGNENMIALLD